MRTAIQSGLGKKVDRMNAEIRMGSSLGFERQRRRAEYRQSYSGPMIQAPPKPLLTRREVDLMRELVKGEGGDGNEELAARLGLTEGTVKVYFCSIRRKLGLRSRTAIALYADRSMFRKSAGESPSPVDSAEAARH
jgi:DNA-binding NarL/FixJ family response regulator